MPDPAIILCRPDRVGDVIIATTCLPPIRRQLPEARLLFVAREVMRPLLDGHPLLHGFIGLSGEASPAALGALAGVFREQGADAIVHLHRDKLCQQAGWRARIPRRLGYRRAWPFDPTLTEAREDRRWQGLRHEAEYNFDLLASLGIHPPPLEELRPSVHLSEASRSSLRAKMATVCVAPADKNIVLNPTAHSLPHRWPPEHFAWLARELRSYCDKVILVGEPAGDPAVKAVGALLGDLSDGIVDLSGGLDLGELGWLLRDAALLVSRNTGTTHLAAAVGCPTVELFGRLEGAYGPVRWRALGSDVRAVNTAPSARRRFESRRAFWSRSHAAIPRELVLAAARESLGNFRSRRGSPL